MPAHFDEAPDRAGLPAIDLAAARVLFRTAESSGLGRPGTDEIFDQWLDDHCDVAFYRGPDRPLQARAVDVRDRVPEWLANSRVGEARLEAVCLNPYRPAALVGRETTPASTEAETVEDTEGAEDTGAGTCCCTPGLCWDCGADKERYAEVHRREDREDGDDGWVLRLVDEYTGGMVEDPSYDLGGELPPDFHAHSFQRLIVLTEAAGRKLDAEGWVMDGPWRLRGLSCENDDVTDPADDTEDIDFLDEDQDGESDGIHYRASIAEDGDVHTVEVVGTRWGEQHIVYREPVSGPGGESPDPGTLEGLRDFLRRATEQVREAGYEITGDWYVGWSRCYVLLADRNR
ncbi:hypothetical protein ACE1SV_39070 [Streptomyces sp. E-15]